MTTGLHCKACDAPIDDMLDPELCPACLAVVYQYNRDLLDGEEDDLLEVSDELGVYIEEEYDDELL